MHSSITYEINTLFAIIELVELCHLLHILIVKLGQNVSRRSSFTDILGWGFCSFVKREIYFLLQKSMKSALFSIMLRSQESERI